MLRLVVLSLVLLSALPAPAQPLADTLFTWQTYAETSRCRVRVYPTGDEDRRRAVVIQELAENAGPSTVSDARHLVELIGRRLSIDPPGAYWIFHWGAFSHPGAAERPSKELFLRATFRRTPAGRLGAPSWRILTREEMQTYTMRNLGEDVAPSCGSDLS